MPMKEQFVAVVTTTLANHTLPPIIKEGPKRDTYGAALLDLEELLERAARTRSPVYGQVEKRYMLEGVAE